jgi:outer membrane protein insertion porin family
MVSASSGAAQAPEASPPLPVRPPADTTAASATPAPPSAPDTTSLAPVESRIGELSVEGNERTDRDRILRSFEVAAGSRYNKDALRRGLRKLFALGLFQDVWLEEFPREGGLVDLLIHVRERPRVGAITFAGNRKRETSELEKKLHLHVGDIVAPTALNTQVDSLLHYYHDEGFSRAKVTVAADTNQSTRAVAVRFDIQEGEKVRITRVEFVGAKAFTTRRLRKAMKTHAKGFFGGGEIKDEAFAEDREKLESFYHNSGYRDARVTDLSTKPGAKPRDLTLVVTVDEGAEYRFGQLQWSGYTILDSAVVRKLAQPRPGDLYSAARIDKAREEAYGEYAERGYLYVDVAPTETAHDGVVDVEFAVHEGRPSQVRLVNITGNHATRERVIRREIDLHEGDRFKKSALVRTQGDIFRLGIFEDVQIDFSPADSTDVDVNLRVKEKQVGTASAGAGYTAQAGVTGFLELAHNNVLGNGQSLALHLERGGRTENYNLSFTEPWFRGTPTLLGFSLFDTRNEQDLYDEKHVGGSVRIGRPLPWPDYSRGSLSYRLEDVTIDGDSATLGPVYAYQTFGKPVRTSSIEAVFSRNSTDNPFYPTKGTRLDLDHEFAGGPLGGHVEFHKHRIEGRAYYPSLLKHVTTMLRARFGLLGDYGDPSRPAPSYERFRLGGGTTLDPLRGYDDYQVVPGKFGQKVPKVVQVDLPAPHDSTYYVRYRYPGGQFMTLYTFEQQFPIVHPLHGVLFFDAGNTWDLWREIQPFDLKIGAGAGLRMEIPMLGNVGLDYGYGFNRDDGPHAKAHFLLGSFSF